VGANRKRVEDVHNVRFTSAWGRAFGTILVTAAWAGCNAVPADKFQETQRELQLAQERVRSLEQQVADEQQSIRHLQTQLARMRGLDKTQLMDELVTAERIELVSPSGAYDIDGRPGDDGITLFVRPIDRDGHVVKCAGTIKVTILDPLSPPNRNVVAEYNFDLPTTRKMWYGRLMTNHFTVRCPWPTGQVPIHDELLAHVVFTDLLTGRVLTASHSYKIKLPPEIKAQSPVDRQQ